MTKQIYWKCVDCNSMINDDNMHRLIPHGLELEVPEGIDVPLYAEYCYGCHSYRPEVVLAYA